MEKLKTIARRTCYAWLALSLVMMIAVYFTGAPKIEYRVSFGNAIAAEVVQLAPTKEQMETLDKADRLDAQKISKSKELRPQEKPTAK